MIQSGVSDSPASLQRGSARDHRCEIVGFEYARHPRLWQGDTLYTAVRLPATVTHGDAVRLNLALGLSRIHHQLSATRYPSYYSPEKRFFLKHIKTLLPKTRVPFKMFKGSTPRPLDPVDRVVGMERWNACGRAGFLEADSSTSVPPPVDSRIIRTYLQGLGPDAPGLGDRERVADREALVRGARRGAGDLRGTARSAQDRKGEDRCSGESGHGSGLRGVPGAKSSLPLALAPARSRVRQGGFPGREGHGCGG